MYQACNTLANIAPTIGPTCVTGTMPVGTGGTIVDGTYVLTSVTYYNVSSCGTMVPGSETIAISGGCIQYVLGGDSGFTGTASVSFAVQGNNITSMLTCADYLNLDGGLTHLDVPTKTFTATPTTYTLFTPNSAAGNSNPDRVDVFTKQ